MEIVSNFYVNPSMETAEAQMKAVNLNNQGQALSRDGKYKEALEFFKEALQLKVRAFGTHSIQAALSYNALGECYLNLKEYDLACENLSKSLSFRETEGETLDTRVTRDNLGRVYEELGDRENARKHRKNGTNLCSYEKCSAAAPKSGEILKTCSRCSSIFYCSANCQKSDWKRHKTFCQKLAPKENK